MKKKIILTIAIVSSLGAVALAQGDDLKSITKPQVDTQFNNFSTEDREAFFKLRDTHEKKMREYSLDVEEIDLSIKKELLADDVNQGRVDSLIDKKAKVLGNMEKERFRFRQDLGDKFGDEFARSCGRGGHRGRGRDGDNRHRGGNHMDGGYMRGNGHMMGY